MKARRALLAALVAAATLTSVAAAGPEAAKQRVVINMKFPQHTFALTPLQVGALKVDTGTISDYHKNDKFCHDEIRDGQKLAICTAAIWTLTGKQGTLTIRERSEWVDSGNPSGCGVAVGTWKVVSGTGQYARIAGGGRSAWEAHCRVWFGRQEGFLTGR